MRKDKTEEFEFEVEKNLYEIQKNEEIKKKSKEWLIESHYAKYDYNFTWMGRPVIQMPQDLIAMQEIIWKLRPDLIIETGIAHGGSLVFYASILNLCNQHGKVLGIDIDIREHNRKEIINHPMYDYIDMIEGSSTDTEIIEKVYKYSENFTNILVVLDSNHTHEHVLSELNAYSPLVKTGGYLVVFDTLIEDMPKGTFNNRPWDVGNNPKTAVYDFLEKNDRFVIDYNMNTKLLLSVAPDGYLLCVK